MKIKFDEPQTVCIVNGANFLSETNDEFYLSSVRFSANGVPTKAVVQTTHTGELVERDVSLVGKSFTLVFA